MKKLAGIWVPKSDAATDLLALNIRQINGGPNAFGDRDVKHATTIDPKNGKDAATANRHPLDVRILTVTDAAHGTLDFAYTEFPEEDAKIGLEPNANRHEIYTYELLGSEPEYTLVLTETAETRVDFLDKLITDPTKQVDLKKHPLTGSKASMFHEDALRVRDLASHSWDRSRDEWLP